VLGILVSSEHCTGGCGL